MPPAARVSDPHLCPLFDGPKPHVGGPILPPGCPTVLIGNLFAARVGDMATCASAPDVIALGSMTVLIGSQPAARMGDLTAHGGSIFLGFPTVIIGDVGMGSPGGGGGASAGAAAAAASAAPAVAAFGSAAATGAALVCKGPCPACGHM